MQIRNIFTTGLLCLISFSLFAQSFQTQKHLTNWRQIQSEHFTVIYTGPHESAARYLARYAEDARYDLGILLDHKPQEMYTLVYFHDLGALLESPFGAEKPDQIPGIVNLTERFGIVVHPGTHQGLYAMTRKAVGKLILDEISFGNRLGQTYQNQLMLHQADWYWDGLLEYLSNGWTYQDEMHMSSLRNEDLLSMALEGESYSNKIVRKSIWHFITHEYGEQKISEIVYLVNIAHSIESGIISVLGITLHTLTERWREYIKARFSNQTNGRLEWADLQSAVDVPIQDGYKLLGFDYYAPSDLLAMLLEKKGKVSLVIYDIENETYTESPYKGGSLNYLSQAYDIRQPLAWDPDGTELAFAIYEKGSYWLAYWKTGQKKIRKIRVRNGIERIMDLSWSPNGNQLAVSAMQKGHSDLYITGAGEANLKAITSDAFDERDPAWSLDNQSIFFSSTRDTTALEIESYNWNSHKRNFDLFRYDLEEDTILRLTNSPTINERNAFAVSSFELVYQSDASGIENLSRINIFSAEQENLTDIAIGVKSMRGMENGLAILSTTRGQANISILNPDIFSGGQKPEPTLLRLEYLAQYQESIALKDNQAEEELQEVEDKPIQSELPEKDQVEEEKSEPVRYYIFDEEEPYEEKSSQNSSWQEKEPSRPIVTHVYGNQKKPDLADYEIEGGGTADNSWKVNYLGVRLNFDPIAKYGPKLNIGVSDFLERHRLDAEVAPFLPTRGADANIRYTYQPGRVDWFAEGGYFSRSFRQENALQADSLLFRFDQVRLNAGALYPLSRFAAIEGGLGIYFIDRKDQQLLRLNPLNDQDRLFRAGLQFMFDNTRERHGYTYDGIMVRAGVNSFYSFEQQEFSFHRVEGEVRHYLKIFQQVVLATRLASAFNLPNRNIQYYLGGTMEQGWPPPISIQRRALADRSNTVDTTLHSFHFQQYLMPLRGFHPNTRQGTRYMMASSELRIPLSRMARSALNSRLLYNVEVIPFVDVGTVWIEGNPFSDKNPTDTQILTNGPITVRLQTLKSPFLIGFGTGIRANVIGYSVRFDFAWGIDDGILQRPMLMTSLGKNF